MTAKKMGSKVIVIPNYCYPAKKKKFTKIKSSPLPQTFMHLVEKSPTPDTERVQNISGNKSFQFAD